MVRDAVLVTDPEENAISLLFSFVDSVKDNPPSTDGLKSDDCERILISLLLEGLIEPSIRWTAYE